MSNFCRDIYQMWTNVVTGHVWNLYDTGFIRDQCGTALSRRLSVESVQNQTIVPTGSRVMERPCSISTQKTLPSL